MNAPQTLEGRQIWDLFLRLRGQWRVGFTGATGLDMGAALAMAAALSVPSVLVADMVPDMEVAALQALAARKGDADG